MERNERVRLFEQMVLCCHDLYLWTFDSSLRLLHSACPVREIHVLLTEQERQTILSHAQQSQKPMLFSAELRVLWIAEPAWTDGSLAQIYALGPFYMEEQPDQDATHLLTRRGLNRTEAASAAAFLKKLPVVPLGHAFEYAIMLHYCVAEERITASDLSYQGREQKPSRRKGQRQTVDVHGTYAMEQEMLRMVREGDLNIREQMNRLAVTGNLGKLSAGDPSRQMKNAVLVNAVLFSRAAIDGGLPPELSMMLTDHYFQSVEACRTLPELKEIAETMQLDFVRRVHRIRSEGYTKPVAACVEWIRTHLEEDLTLQDLAARLNYSEYYLSRRFKLETGENLKAYILSARLERARTLLADPALSIREISERLCFCSQSYFAEQFKKAYSVTPAQYRSKAQFV